MKTPVTSTGLKEHLRYNWWKYLLIIALGIGLVDMAYSVTAYRPPRDKVLGFYVYGYMAEDAMTEYLDHVKETEFPDMEKLNSELILTDGTYGPMQLTAFLAAGDGDIYLLPREQFLTYASSGSLLPLEYDEELMALFDGAGVSLQTGWRRETESGETHLYGIPQDKLPGLSQYAWAEDGYLCMIITGGNQENAAKLLRVLCRDCLNEPPAAEPVSEAAE